MSLGLVTGSSAAVGSGRGARAAVWLLALACVVLAVALLVVDHVCRARGLREAMPLTWSSAPFVLAAVGAVGVGALVSIRRPEHPVGWLIWGLGVALLLAGVVDGYAAVGLLGQHPVDLPGAGVSAGIANAAFVPWLTMLTLILTLTPSGEVRPRWARRGAAVCVWAGVLFFLGRVVRPGRLDFPLQGVVNPVGVNAALAGVVRAVTGMAAVVVNLGLIVSVGLVLYRFRTSSGEDRAQLKWVAVAGVGIALMAFVPAIAVSQLSPSTADAVISVSIGGGFVLVLGGIAASVLRYRLYEVDRVLSVGVAYLLVTAVVAAVFVIVTLGLSQLSASPGSSSLRVAASTLAAAAAAGSVRRPVQDMVDRRFHRRRYEATAVMRTSLASPPTGRDDAEQALRAATGDASIRVGYPRAGGVAGEFVAADGSPFKAAPGEDRDTLPVMRGKERVAIIDHSVAASPTELVSQCAQMALTEFDNLRLRAELRTRLVEAEHSRARLAQAASLERHRLERNLHDGAQQRLVAVMVALRTTTLRAARGVPNVPELQVAIDDLGIAVRELRELANGLVPALLGRDGLSAALHDLAERCPVPVDVDAQVPRLEPAVEETAYYVAAEGLANAMKHAAASRIAITATTGSTGLALEVRDDGVGGADPTAPGLLGLVDRAHVLRGELRVSSPCGGGTALRLELPCA